MIIKWDWLMNILSLINDFKVDGFAFFPFVFIRGGVDPQIINHEKIHLRQQLETLVIFFYLIYGVHYLLLRIKYDHYNAYRNIIFEKEAYTNQSKTSYLKNRKSFSWTKY
jgi:hypothetical protein